jgi:SsrA-binding protein
MIEKPKTKKIEFFNRKARFDYEILESLEVGIVLTGLEIKAIRSGRVTLAGSYAKILNGEIFWVGGNILVAGEPQRTRKLLLKQAEIKKLIGKVQEQGLTLVPLKLYLTRGRAKLELGIGRGRKARDKREKLKKADRDREAQIQLKEKS